MLTVAGGVGSGAIATTAAEHRDDDCGTNGGTSAHVDHDVVDDTSNTPASMIL